MSIMETEDAIEKLAKYRESTKKKIDLVEKKVREPNPTTEKIRHFAIKITWFNSFYYATLTVLLVFGGFLGGEIGFLSLPLAIITGLFTRQTLKEIIRLEATDGRKTFFDDAFIMTIAPIMFILLYPFVNLEAITFIIIQVGFLVFWSLQIYFLFFTKPDIRYRKESLIAGYEDIELLNSPRKILLGIAGITGLLLSIPSFL